jgi:hypothetical protein
VVANTRDSAVDRVFLSLPDALAAHRIPIENHALIRRFCDHLNIERYEGRSGYIKAVRRDGGPSLQINYGWTNGFNSEVEARAAVGDDASCWASTRGTGLWGVTHPIHSIGNGGGGTQTTHVDYGTCPQHFLKLPANGVCDDCA